MKKDPIQEAIARLGVLMRELHLLSRVEGESAEIALEAVNNGLRVAEGAVQSLKRLDAAAARALAPIRGYDLLEEAEAERHRALAK